MAQEREFTDGSSIKNVAPGMGTVPGAPAPTNPPSGAPDMGLGLANPDLPSADSATGTVDQGMVADPDEAAGDQIFGGLGAPQNSAPAPSGGTANQGSQSGPGAGPAYFGRMNDPRGDLAKAKERQNAPKSQPGQGPVPKGGAAIPAGRPPSPNNFKPKAGGGRK